MRRNEEYVGKRVLHMELPGTRRSGRPKRRFMDAVREDMRDLRVTEEDAKNRGKWKKTISSGDP